MSGAHGRNAQSRVWRKKKGSPRPVIGPVLKNLPNWLSHKKNLIPETPVRPNTIFSGWLSNWRWRAYNSGLINRIMIPALKTHLQLKRTFHCLLMISSPPTAPAIGISENNPLVMTASPAKSDASTRWSVRKSLTGRGYGHTRYDTVDKVTLANLRDAASLAARIALRIANEDDWPVSIRRKEAVKELMDQPDSATPRNLEIVWMRIMRRV